MGDYIGSPEWTCNFRVEDAIGNMVRHNFPPEVVERVKKMHAAFRYAEREWEKWRSFVQEMEQARSCSALVTVKELVDNGYDEEAAKRFCDRNAAGIKSLMEQASKV